MCACCAGSGSAFDKFDKSLTSNYKQQYNYCIQGKTCPHFIFTPFGQCKIEQFFRPLGLRFGGQSSFFFFREF